MTRYRVYDEQSARLLAALASSADTIELLGGGEYLSANPGDVILAPSIRNGEVLYIRIKGVVPAAPPHHSSENSVALAPNSNALRLEDLKPAGGKQYIATGFLGLDGEVEEDMPQPPKPWWKRMFID